MPSPISAAKLRGTKLQSEVEELENMNTSQNEENIQLRRDKMILSDHVADLKSQVFLILCNFLFILISIYIK